MLVKFCIKCAFHFSFLTRIRSYSALFWFDITVTGVDIDTGQDMTGFQDFNANCQISSLSQCDPELVTDTF